MKIVATSDGDMLRPAKFFCCVNACSHDHQPRFWYGKGIVIFPPKGFVLKTEDIYDVPGERGKNKALYLIEGEERATQKGTKIIIARTIDEVKVTGGHSWEPYLKILSEELEYEKTSAQFERWEKEAGRYETINLIEKISRESHNPQEFKNKFDEVIGLYRERMNKLSDPPEIFVPSSIWWRWEKLECKIDPSRIVRHNKSEYDLENLSIVPGFYKFGTAMFQDEEPFLSHDKDVASVLVNWEGRSLGIGNAPILINCQPHGIFISLYDRAYCDSPVFNVLLHVLLYCSELPDQLKEKIREMAANKDFRTALFKYAAQIYHGARYAPLNARGVKSLVYALAQYRVLAERPEAYKTPQFYTKRYIYDNAPEAVKAIILRQTTKTSWTEEDLRGVLHDLGLGCERVLETTEGQEVIIFDPELFLKHSKEQKIKHGFAMFDEKKHLISEDSYGYELYPWREEGGDGRL